MISKTHISLHSFISCEDVMLSRWSTALFLSWKFQVVVTHLCQRAIE
jgi:hypothetical protein